MRSPENWLSLAQDSEGNTVGLPARALFLQPDLTGAWRECKVHSRLDLKLPYERGSSRGFLHVAGTRSIYLAPPAVRTLPTQTSKSQSIAFLCRSTRSEKRLSSASSDLVYYNLLHNELLRCTRCLLLGRKHDIDNRENSIKALLVEIITKAIDLIQVTDYDTKTGEWVVEWLEGTTKERDTQLKLPRLRVYLRAEDPFNFADRVADAHASREVRKNGETKDRNAFAVRVQACISCTSNRVNQSYGSVVVDVGCRRAC